MKKKFRSAQNDEICKIFYQVFMNEDFIRVWQDIESSKCISDAARAKIKDISFNAGAFEVEFEGLYEAFDYDKDFYFVKDDTDFVFKARHSKHPKRMVFFLPEEVQVIEKREFRRLKIDRGRKISLGLEFTSRDSGRNIKIKCPVLDISKGGASLFITKDTFNAIDLKKPIILSDLKGLGLEKDRLNVIFRNAVKVGKKVNYDDLLRVGMSFSD